MELTQKNITTAYAKLQDARHRLARAAEEHAIAKHALDETEARSIAEGVDGKNETERKANLRVLHNDLHTHLHDTETELIAARLEYDQATFTVEELKLQLRLLEVTARQLEGSVA